MARIVYNSTTIGGKMVAEAVDHIRKGRDLLTRASALANSISAGGVTPALLESSPEFGVVVGQGSNFYTAVNNMKTNAATVSDTAIADIDQGG
jgi:hypothetical protein